MKGHLDMKKLIGALFGAVSPNVEDEMRRQHVRDMLVIMQQVRVVTRFTAASELVDAERYMGAADFIAIPEARSGESVMFAVRGPKSAAKCREMYPKMPVITVDLEVRPSVRDVSIVDQLFRLLIRPYGAC